jgi:hypothetical protein
LFTAPSHSALTPPLTFPSPPSLSFVPLKFCIAKVANFRSKSKLNFLFQCCAQSQGLSRAWMCGEGVAVHGEARRWSRRMCRIITKFTRQIWEWHLSPPIRLHRTSVTLCMGAPFLSLSTSLSLARARSLSLSLSLPLSPSLSLSLSLKMDQDRADPVEVVPKERSLVNMNLTRPIPLLPTPQPRGLQHSHGSINRRSTRRACQGYPRG